jgi:perosamine synthetase
MKISVSEPDIQRLEMDYVNECLRTNWISSNGKFIPEFEEAFAKYCGAEHGISTTSGTSALHLGLASLGIGSGDEVIVPNFTIISCANAVLYTGARPVFVDVEPDTWCIDPEKIREKITPKTRAIMPVHMFGHPCDMDAIEKIAEENNLYVIEDAAQAHGAEYKGKKVGGFGDISCFSFYANKIVTTGEGGMVLTNNSDVAEKARSMKNLSFDRERTFTHSDISFNYRMTNIQAAIGLAQLSRIEKTIETKRKNAQLYSRLLSSIPWLRTPVESEHARSVYWMYPVLVDSSMNMNRDDVRKHLENNGIETRMLFAPMYSQPALRDVVNDSNPSDYTVSDDLYRRGFYLPSGSKLSEEQIRFVADTLGKMK